jgi:ATPase subunit of ABC transporter with duplicated ATPase domains
MTWICCCIASRSQGLSGEFSHDRRLLERSSRDTVWLDRGVTRVLDEGFSAFEAWRDAVLAQEADEQHKLGRKIAMEENWLRYGVTARRTRNQRRLAELHAMRRKRREHRGTTGAPINKGIDKPHRVVRGDVIVNRLRQQQHLTAGGGGFLRSVRFGAGCGVIS